jgi:hypothetical protein
MDRAPDPKRPAVATPVRFVDLPGSARLEGRRLTNLATAPFSARHERSTTDRDGALLYDHA